jgi:hypothetical protein
LFGSNLHFPFRWAPKLPTKESKSEEKVSLYATKPVCY